jgi:hypothetical protein
LFIVNDEASIADATQRSGTPLLAPKASNAFWGWNSARLANFLRASGTKSLSLDYFFIADGQTAEDQTLLLVMVQDQLPAVRMDVETIPFQLLQQRIWGHTMKGLPKSAGADAGHHSQHG